MGKVDRRQIGKGERVKEEAEGKKRDRKSNDRYLTNGFNQGNRKSEGQSKNKGEKQSETSMPQDLQIIGGLGECGEG